MSSKEITKNLLKGNTCDNCCRRGYDEWPDHDSYCFKKKNKKRLPKILTCQDHKFRYNDKFFKGPDKAIIEAYSEALQKTLAGVLGNRNNEETYEKIHNKIFKVFSNWKTKDIYE
jgi:hypothetical protein